MARTMMRLISLTFAVVLTLFGVCYGGSAGILNTCSQPDHADGNYAHPVNCNQFLQCNNGVTVEVDCPENLVYNEQTRLCDNLEYVPRCQPTTTQAPTTTTTTTMSPEMIATICEINGYPTGYYPHPHDCTKFLQCNRNNTHVVTCPAGLVFNHIRRLCDILDRVPRCWDNTQPTTTPSSVWSTVETVATSIASTTAATTISSTDTDTTLNPFDITNRCYVFSYPNGIYPHPTDCGLYMECKGGSTTIHRCHHGLVYNEFKHFCDLIVNVPRCDPGSGTTTISTGAGSTTMTTGMSTSTLDPNDIQSVCRHPGFTDGKYPHPTSCSKYLKCSGGVTTVHDCPNDLVFNELTRMCDLDIHVPRCYFHGTARPGPVGATPVALSGYHTYCRDKRLLSGIYPDPWSCKTFIDCSYGATYHMRCPDDLLFDDTALTCRYPVEVDCKQVTLGPGSGQR